jgi:hypothetical protein
MLVACLSFLQPRKLESCLVERTSQKIQHASLLSSMDEKRRNIPPIPHIFLQHRWLQHVETAVSAVAHASVQLKG